MIWVIVFAVGVFILGWEALAFLTGQEKIPTWTRLIRGIWKNDRPEMRPVIFIVTLTVGCIVVTWMAIHFVVY